MIGLIKKVNFPIIFIVVLVIFLSLKPFIKDDEDLIITSEDSKEVILEEISIYVDIKGAVKNPGVYKIEQDKRLNDVIIAAGGYEEANELCLNLSEKIYDQEEIYVPAENEECNDEAVKNGIVNINKADQYDLMQIAGIGEVKAQAIVEYREQNGNFTNIEEIKNVDGIGESTYAKIKDQITV